MRRPDRRSKIVCTLGPSIQTEEALSDLILAGMDVARINFSHGAHEQHKIWADWIRNASNKLNIPVAILGDLQGPKIRTGKISTDPKEMNSQFNSLPLRVGQSLFFRGLDSGEAKKSGDGSKKNPITISYPRLAVDLKIADIVLFDDGLVRMKVTETFPTENLVQLTVEHGKTLGENKGVNMPGAKLSTLGITEKDWGDIQFALDHNFDFLALSFVRSAREVKSLKNFLTSRGSSAQVISKIEKAEALENLDEILFQSDGLMVARGDLGVEIGNDKVPLVQKDIIRRSRLSGKPVITATQMLMSMVSSPTPTRAEASDVANAVLDGSDALMLSNETASGDFPLESVRTMHNIILGAEGIQPGQFGVKDTRNSFFSGETIPISEAIEAAATSLARSIGAKALACLTRSGQAARQLAKYRPPVPIFAFAENPKVRAQLCLCWGVSVVPWKEVTAQDYTLFDELVSELGRLGFLSDGDSSVLTAGIPTSRQVGTTNTVVVKKFPVRRDSTSGV